jgi:hypothetical protein
MDVILHLGAHRTATTTFQHYIRDQQLDLAAQNIEFWGPQRVRKIVFPGLFRNSVARKGRNVARRAEGRIAIHAAQAQMRGVEHLLVSDENLLGTCIQNLRAARLYPGAGERTARMAKAFGGQLRRIVISIRAQDLWWASACALTVSRGHPVPDAARLEAISLSQRTWRDVITDVACAAPDVKIDVLPYESCAGRPDRLLETALATTAQPDLTRRRLNQSPDLHALRAMLNEQGADPDQLPDQTGRWQPFNEMQAARLRENYADDLHWLTAGADGLARLTEDKTPKRADTGLPHGAMTKGHTYDPPERHLAQGS